MKKGIKVLFAGLGLLFLGGVGVATAMNHEIVPVYAEGEDPEPGEGEQEDLAATVKIDKVEHGTIAVNITEGVEGDVAIVTAKHDILYKVGFVKVNGVQLIESEETRGEFSFTLVRGENLITASFVIDEELCGDLTTIIQQASDKDWTNLFTVENLIVLIKWILDGGILIALIRYYVKDKKLEKRLEDTTRETIDKIIPQTTRDTVVATVKDVVTPLYSQTQADMVEVKQCMTTFARCIALMQENTPDSRRAVLSELSTLKTGDVTSVNIIIDNVKKYIDELMAQHDKTYQETMAAINNINQQNKEIIEAVPAEEPVVEEELVVDADNGTSI